MLRVGDGYGILHAGGSIRGVPWPEQSICGIGVTVAGVADVVVLAECQQIWAFRIEKSIGIFQTCGISP